MMRCPKGSVKPGLTYVPAARLPTSASVANGTTAVAKVRISRPWTTASDQGAISSALAYAALVGDIDPAKLTHEQRDFYLKQTLVTKENVDSILTSKFDASLYAYDKLKQNFWANVTGGIEPGANQ